MDKIRLVIADDHDLVRYGLVAFLQTLPDIDLLGEATDGEEAIQLVDELQPDIVLMDLIMPHMDGLEAITHLKNKYPELPIIGLTSFDEDYREQALTAGAILCLPKDVDHDELAAAIRSAVKR